MASTSTKTTKTAAKSKAPKTAKPDASKSKKLAKAAAAGKNGAAKPAPKPVAAPGTNKANGWHPSQGPTQVEVEHRVPLSSGQVRILEALAETGGWLSFAVLAERGHNGHAGQCFNSIGPADPAKRAITAKRPGCRPGLLLLDYCRTKTISVDGETGGTREQRVYQITGAGKKALAAEHKRRAAAETAK